MATHYKITAPDPTYNGMVGRAAFHQGVARIDAEGMDAELRYFTRRGYTVELVEETPIKEVELVEETPIKEVELVEETPIKEVELVEETPIKEVELVEETPIKKQTPSRGRGGTSKTGG